jgi:hypothetical protein
MKQHTTIALLLAAAALAAQPAMADHNSPMGAGWANMPNDIHNTRVDTRLEDDNDAFLDFVQYGAGADSVNRYLTTTTTATKATTSASAAPVTGGGRAPVAVPRGPSSSRR